jgi:hypothetical protein
LSEVAVASQVVGFAEPFEDGEADEGLELTAELFVGPLVVAVLLSFLIFEQPAVLIAIANKTSTTRKSIFKRSNFLASHVGITEVILSLQVVFQLSMGGIITARSSLNSTEGALVERINGYEYAAEGGGAAEGVDGEVVGEVVDALAGVLSSDF